MRIKIRIENWELGMKFRFRNENGNGNWKLKSCNLFGVGKGKALCDSIRKKPLSDWDRGWDGGGG
jgi:hypothetical protein